MSIGETITRKRKALGMTQKELAEKLSVSFQAVSKWENISRNVSPTTSGSRRWIMSAIPLSFDGF